MAHVGETPSPDGGDDDDRGKGDGNGAGDVINGKLNFKSNMRASSPIYWL